MPRHPGLENGLPKKTNIGGATSRMPITSPNHQTNPENQTSSGVTIPDRQSTHMAGRTPQKQQSGATRSVKRSM
jgi:hypothetical protein